MNTYTFHVRGAGSPYDLTLENETDEGAHIAAKGIVGNGRTIELADKSESTLEDFLAPSYFERFAAKKRNMKSIGQWKEDRRPKP